MCLSLLAKCNKVVLIVPYLPYYAKEVYTLLGIGHSPEEWCSFYETLYTYYYRVYEALGPRRLAIVPLALEFDPYDVQFYSCTPIEPSVHGGRILCRSILDHIGMYSKGVAHFPVSPHDVGRRLLAHLRRCHLRRDDLHHRPNMTPFLKGWRLKVNVYFVALYMSTLSVHAIGNSLRLFYDKLCTVPSFLPRRPQHAGNWILN